MLKWIALLATVTAVAADCQVSDCGDITIHVQKAIFRGQVNLAYAEKQAGQILATAGVQVRWTPATPGPSEKRCGAPIVIRFATGEQHMENPRALAYSVPLNTEVGDIIVFWDRLTKAGVRNLCPAGNLLAHVLAHEIVHVLEAVEYHSDTGLMRESWSYEDFFKMLRGHLPLTQTDIFLVHSGIASRMAHTPRPVLAPNSSSETNLPLDPNLPPR